MNFSDEWRSLFPIPSIFPSPSLISSAAIGPLHLRPLDPRPHLLSHLPSLQIPPPLHPPSQLAALRSFFNSSSFLPHSVLSSLLASHLPPFSDVDPASSNLLCSLPSRSSPSSALLFFPTGENSHSLCVALLNFDESVAASKISVQNEGFKQPYHRILKVSAVPASSEHDSADPTVEGFLIAVTLYSANWFRVETRIRVSEQEKGGIFIVPMAKQGFESSVVDACLCRSWPERSVVL